MARRKDAIAVFPQKAYAFGTLYGLVDKRKEALINMYAEATVVMLMIDFLLKTAVDMLNIRALEKRMPEEFRDTFDKAGYETSQRYTAVKLRFGMLSSGVGLATLFLFWFSGGFGTLDAIVRGFGFHALINGLLYIGALLLLRAILSLPFSVYNTFVIEERFGFNRTTPRTFRRTMLAKAVLTVVIGAPALLGVQALFMYAGVFALIWAWIALVLFLGAVYFITPAWLMPLFMKFTPLPNGELKEKIIELAERLSFPTSRIYVIDGSSRSSKANAFFVGFGKHKCIALFDTLIAGCTTTEVIAVLAHEIGHSKKRHTLKGFCEQVVNQGLMLFIFSLLLANPAASTALIVPEPSVYATMVFFGFFFSLASTVLFVIHNMISRKYESEADAYAKEHLGDGDVLISGLKKLSRTNVSNLTPHQLYVFMHYTHPPILARITALRNKKK